MSCARPDLMRGLGSNAQAYATVDEQQIWDKHFELYYNLKSAI